MKNLTKTLIASAIVAGGIFAGPVAANAADYTPPTTPVVTGPSGAGAVAPGAAVTINFGDHTFTDGGSISAVFSSTGDVPATGTLSPAVFVAAQSNPITGTASGTGSAVLRATVPADASSAIQVAVTDAATGHVVSATIAVAGTGAGSNLATTGTYISIATIWGAVGLLALGGGLIAVRVAVRRKDRPAAAHAA
ncbi:hypothetical protein [Gryllotalpicola protaetiae]|uniref:Sortase n=1 Tax=Gryllotalpicola protaetiae TaxID=2419771 RepID=A0A387BQ32_9MICO|nr:hypothetical protein [Gryllotalpicola protaetiae]AYG04184.1 hypothetical protein D7I44_12010 [Gryllotalpicola protaetiae]